MLGKLNKLLEKIKCYIKCNFCCFIKNIDIDNNIDNSVKIKYCKNISYI